MEGGIYPHTARINHSCKPNCRFVYREGRIDVWARQPIPAGEEITISYRATDHFSGKCRLIALLYSRYEPSAMPSIFPSLLSRWYLACAVGMPWDIRSSRQKHLLDSYDFNCQCVLCTEGCPGLQSLNCMACAGELRPGTSGSIVECSCGTKMSNAGSPPTHVCTAQVPSAST